jgi:hypothetical protein
MKKILWRLKDTPARSATNGQNFFEKDVLRLQCSDVEIGSLKGQQQ